MVVGDFLLRERTRGNPDTICCLALKSVFFMAFAGTEEDTGHSNLGKREPNGTNKAHKLCCFF